MRTTFVGAQLAILALIGSTNASSFKTDGLWTKNANQPNAEYDDSGDGKIGVKNGIPYSDDATRARFIAATMTRDGDMTNWDQSSYTNVQRVKNIITKDVFENKLFSQRDKDFYTYDGFMRAVAKYPAFCNESNLTNSFYKKADGTHDLDKACKRELAFIFAHVAQETGAHNATLEDANGDLIPEYKQGLEAKEEASPPSHGYRSTDHLAGIAYAPVGSGDDKVSYHGRGPLQVSWNANYGAFAEVLYEDKYNKSSVLLNNPEKILDDDYTAFFGSLWFYMTPQNPKPSMHDVATGFNVPTSVDTANGHGQGDFGITTNIINGGQECNTHNGSTDDNGNTVENYKSQNRIDYHKGLLEFFNINGDHEDEAHMGCLNENDVFPSSGGYGNGYNFFDTDWDWTGGEPNNRCKPVTWATQYNVGVKDDYKRCVCDKFGQGSTSCMEAGTGLAQSKVTYENEDTDGGELAPSIITTTNGDEYDMEEFMQMMYDTFGDEEEFEDYTADDWDNALYDLMKLDGILF